MQLATMAIKTETPTPTLTPIMILLLTPPVSPSITLLIQEDGVGTYDTGETEETEEVCVTGGIYDTGLPLVALISRIFSPKAIVLTTVLCVVAGNVALEPEGTAVTRVLVAVFLEVDCSEAGQFMSPVDRHTVAVYVTSVLIVVVVRSSLASIMAAVAAALAAEVTLPLTAHTSRMVVYQIGICVVGAGPHVFAPIASVAPAFAPRSIVYSSTTCSSQTLLSPGAVVTLVTNCATSAQTSDSRPALKLREWPAMVTVGVFNSRPAVMPMRRRAVNTTPGLWIVTGRNSNLPPVL